MDLAIYLEMLQTGFPVDPNAVVEKLDISASDKKRWLGFIQAQKEAEEKAQAHQIELEKLKIETNAQLSIKKTDSGEKLGYEKLGEAKRKGNMKHAVDSRKLELSDREDELTFITENRRIDVQRDQQKQAQNKAA